MPPSEKQVFPSEQLGQETAREAGEVTAASPLLELGVTGLKHAAGYIDEEFLPQLKGRKAVQVYREMGENDPISGAMIFALTQLVRQVDWRVAPAGKSQEHAAAANFLESCMNDMSQTWDDTVVEIASSLQYGWSMHEIVYKRRVGPWQRDGRTRSKYTDGLFGWRKLPIRSQETLLRWMISDSGSIQGMVQLSPPDYKTRILPIERCLLFRTGHRKENPEGRSILRTSYRPWYYKKRLEEIESVGVERDLAGLPMVSVPVEYMRAKPGSEQHKMVESMRKLVRSTRRNEQEGIVFPTAYDQETKQPQFKFELLSSGGGRQHNTDSIIQRYEQRQLMTILADWIMVGHSKTGTYNMHLDKTSIFRDAINGIVDGYAEVFNRYAVPRLFALNGWRPAELPKIVASAVDKPDLTQLSAFLTATNSMGFNWGPDGDMERFLRSAANLPELSPEDMARRQRMARMDEAARFAETQTRAMAARSQLMASMLGQGQGGQDVGTQGQEGQNGVQPPTQ